MNVPRAASFALSLTLAAGCGDGVEPLQLDFYHEIHAVTIDADLVYGTGAVRRPFVHDKELLLDLYRPAAPDAPTPRPGIVLLHGGGFTSGSRTSPSVVDLGMRYAARGYVAISIEYRLTGDDPPTEALATDPTDTLKVAAAAARVDAALAVEWLRDNAATYGVDPDRIAVAGYSAGGITAMGVAYWAPGIQRADVAAVFSLSGGLPSAEDTIDGGEPPLLMVHGETDPARLLHEAAATRAALVGLPYEMYEIPGVGHDTPGALDTVLGSMPVREIVASFLYHRMDLAGLAGAP